MSEYNAYIELAKELAKKTSEVTMLRSESGIALEAINRYCPPELYESAREWLKTKGLG